MLQNCTRSRFPECNANMPLSLRCEIDQMFNPGKTLHEVDPDLWAAVQQENQRQEDHVELIASETIDYGDVGRLAREHKPRMIVAGASAYSRVIDWRRLREVADEARAYLMADIAHYAGLIAAGLYPSPIGIADFVTSTTHKTLRGPRGGLILAGTEHEKILNAAIL